MSGRCVSLSPAERAECLARLEREIQITYENIMREWFGRIGILEFELETAPSNIQDAFRQEIHRSFREIKQRSVQSQPCLNRMEEKYIERCIARTLGKESNSNVA